MSAPICLYCGYSRAVQVAGCEHATLPSAGPEMTNAFRALEPLREVCGDRGSSLEVCQMPKGHDGLHEAGPYSWGSVDDLGTEERLGLYRSAFESAEDRAQEAEATLTTEREKGNLLAAELVDLQRQVMGRDEALAALGAELERALRDNGRLRADLESTQQLLAEAERGGAR